MRWILLRRSITITEVPEPGLRADGRVKKCFPVFVRAIVLHHKICNWRFDMNCVHDAHCIGTGVVVNNQLNIEPSPILTPRFVPAVHHL